MYAERNPAIRMIGPVALLAVALLAFCLQAGETNCHEDAALNAVHFTDVKNGWAVGDQGTVMRTTDGGGTWLRQTLPTRAPLTAIQMHDARRGVIGGRTSIPYGVGSTGVVFKTENGGEHWSEVSMSPLPGVRCLAFDGPGRGWIISESAEQHPGGIAFTVDGCSSWNVLRCRRTNGWNAAAHLGFEHLLLCGHAGDMMAIHQGVPIAAKANWLPTSAGRDFSGNKDRLWAVGDQGQVLFSTDQGRNWGRADLSVTDDMRAYWDFRAVSSIDEHVWIVGRPGSMVLCSKDAGRKWTTYPTGQSLPLHDLCFVNERNGWAVGAMGCILRTSDGGQTWIAQRPSDLHAAILWIDSDGRGVPLSAVARYGGEEGFRNVVFALAAPDMRSGTPGLSSRPLRVAESMRAVGGAYVDVSSRFPSSLDEATATSASVVASWQHRDSNAQEAIVRELTMAIRLWRPAVIVAGSGETPQASILSSIVESATRRAFDAAARADYCPEHVRHFGLNEHEAAKLYLHTCYDSGRPANGGAEKTTARIMHSSGDYGARLGVSYADASDSALALLHESYRRCESAVDFRLAAARLEGAQSHRLLTSGLSFPPGSAARRTLGAPNAVAKDAIKRAQLKKNLLAIAEHSTSIVPPDRLVAQIQEASGQFERDQAAQVIYYLAQRLIERGNWELAHNTFELLIQHHPDHALSRQAYRWLISYQVSGEARQRALRPVTIGRENVRIERVTGNDTREQSQVQRAVSVEVSNPANSVTIWNRRAVDFGNRLKQTAPSAWSDPQIQLNLAAAQRRLGFTQSKLADAHYDAILETDPNSRWAQTIGLEKWFFKRELAIPRAIAWSLATTERPYLDGDFDDACWTAGVKTHALQSGDTSIDTRLATSIRLRHDRDFLYIAANCNSPEPTATRQPVARAGRDSDLSKSDRIEILIDLDRDYNSFYRLIVDDQGRVADDCWGDRTWDPRWFVAHARDTTSFRIEAAIPFAELTDADHPSGSTWAFNCLRVTPGIGMLAWSAPTANGRPESFTFLKFMDRGDNRTDAPKAN